MNQSNLPSVLHKTPLCPALVMNIIQEAGLLISGHTHAHTSYREDMDQNKGVTTGNLNG